MAAPLLSSKEQRQAVREAILVGAPHALLPGLPGLLQQAAGRCRPGSRRPWQACWQQAPRRGRQAVSPACQPLLKLLMLDDDA
jgi:hypothetical protein